MAAADELATLQLQRTPAVWAETCGAWMCRTAPGMVKTNNAAAELRGAIATCGLPAD